MRGALKYLGQLPCFALAICPVEAAPAFALVAEPSAFALAQTVSKSDHCDSASEVGASSATVVSFGGGGFPEAFAFVLLGCFAWS